MREVEISACNPESLVDLKDLSIDANKPFIDRVESYLSQVKNPYLFKVDDVIVKIQYGTEKTFSEALSTILMME